MKKKKMKLLCKIGLHIPLDFAETKILFIDKISHKPVFKCKCACGKIFMKDNTNNLGFKVEI